MPVGTIDVRERVLSRSNRVARDVRRRLEEGRTLALNVIGAEGSGKTLLLERTLQALNRELSVAIVTGDARAQDDAHRLARHTGRLVQAVVGHDGRHLDATQIERALQAIDLAYTDLLCIENVGNLDTAPAWDLGESARVVLYDVTDGYDRPMRYPEAFRRADVVVFTKMDLLAHAGTDPDLAVAHARDLRPDVPMFFVSARTGEGMGEWYDLLRTRVRELRVPSA